MPYHACHGSALVFVGVVLQGIGAVQIAQHSLNSLTGIAPILLPKTSNCSSGVIAPVGRVPVPGLLTQSDNFLARSSSRHDRSILGFSPVRGATLQLINAGQGTTATHAIHSMMCRYGWASVHYRGSCHTSREVDQLAADIVQFYARAKACIKDMERLDKGCEVEPLFLELRGKLQALVTSGVQVISDVPYASLLPEFLALVPDVKVLLSVRDANTWAVKRVTSHRGLDLVCQPNAVRRAASYFNTLECIAGVEHLSDALEQVAAPHECTPGSVMEIHGENEQHGDVCRAVERKNWTCPIGCDFAKRKGPPYCLWAETKAPCHESTRPFQDLAAKFAWHNVYVANLVKPSNLAQWCAWDDDSMEALDAIVRAWGLAPIVNRPQSKHPFRKTKYSSRRSEAGRQHPGNYATLDDKRAQ